MRNRPLTTALFYILLLIFTGWYVVPFFWALATSVKHPGWCSMATASVSASEYNHDLW